VEFTVATLEQIAEVSSYSIKVKSNTSPDSGTLMIAA